MTSLYSVFMYRARPNSQTRTIEWSFSIILTRVGGHVRENRYLHPSFSIPRDITPCTKYAMNRPMLYYGEFTHEICVSTTPSFTPLTLTLWSPFIEGTFSTSGLTRRKIVPWLKTSAFRDNGISQETSMETMHVFASKQFILNSDAVYEYSKCKLKGGEEQRSWITV